MALTAPRASSATWRKDDNKIIVTTIQKLNNLMKERRRPADLQQAGGVYF
jgi:type I site-specific restriction-modification system R (restriction) subunit